ncbi:MAG: L,D-transpeptidase family protein, partial [Rhodanobacteraceae bacterium]
DDNEFGPGKIDGKMGEFFGKALVAYKKAHGLPPTGAVDEQLLAQVPQPYTTYTIRPEDEQFVGETASKPSEQAKLKAMKYGSLLEFVAERYHAAEDFLRKLNPGMDLEQLKVGDTVNVPNVQPFEIEKLSEHFIPANPALAGREIFIDTRERFLEVHEGDKLVAEFPITPGSKTLPAPLGVWKILGVAVLPWFRHDEGVLMHGVRTNDFYNIPPGPNNPVGILWMGLNKPGIGIHGTNNPETIGRAGSHGCIRMANWDAVRIKDLVSVGNKVTITMGVPFKRTTVASGSPR